MAFLGVIQNHPNHPYAHTNIVFGGARPAILNSANLAATISVCWGFVLHQLELTPEQWATVAAGKELAVKGKGYMYEGKFFQNNWFFNNDDYDLVVTYGEFCRIGYSGSLSEDMICEHPPVKK
jgi:hypothetical protein